MSQFTYRCSNCKKEFPSDYIDYTPPKGATGLLACPMFHEVPPKKCPRCTSTKLVQINLWTREEKTDY